MSLFALPNCSGTGGSMRNASYTTDFISGMFSIAAIVISPPEAFTADRISRASRACSFTPARPIHFNTFGKKSFIPPKELKHVANNKLWQASSRVIPNRSASSSTDPEDE
ncbi:hypothetical protein CR513_25526, partial [Mucuna pruriens]